MNEILLKFVMIASIVAYILLIHILYKGKRSMNKYTRGGHFAILINGLDVLSDPLRDSDPDIEHSAKFHVNKWFSRLGYKETKFDYNFNSDTERIFEIKGKTPPSSVRFIALLFAFFRVLFFPFTFEER